MSSEIANVDVRTLERSVSRQKFDHRKDYYGYIEKLEISSNEIKIRLCLNLLNNRNWRIRQAAAEQILDSSSDLALLVMRSLLLDKSHEVRNLAAYVIGDIGNSSDTYRLTIAAQDKSWIVRHSAMESLGQVGGSKGMEWAIYLLKNDPNYVVRRDAAGVLANNGHPNAIPYIEEALKEEGANSRAKTGMMFALYRLGVKSYLSQIMDYLANGSPQHREDVFISLKVEALDREDLPYVIHRLRKIVQEATDEDRIVTTTMFMRENRVDTATR